MSSGVGETMTNTYKKSMHHPVTQLEPNLLAEPGLNTDTGESIPSIPTKGSADVANLEKKVQDVPPDGGYGWVCVACIFMVNAHTWGLNSVCSLGLKSLGTLCLLHASLMEFSLLIT